MSSACQDVGEDVDVEVLIDRSDCAKVGAGFQYLYAFSFSSRSLLSFYYFELYAATHTNISKNINHAQCTKELCRMLVALSSPHPLVSLLSSHLIHVPVI